MQGAGGGRPVPELPVGAEQGGLKSAQTTKLGYTLHAARARRIALQVSRR